MSMKNPRITWVAWMLAMGAPVASLGQMVITRSFSVNEAVPDVGELVNAQSFGVAGATVAEVSLTLQVAGTGDGGFNGDLYAALSHGSAFSVLLNRSGKNTAGGAGYGDDGFNVTFSDSGASDIHDYRVALGGNASTPVPGGPTGIWQPDGRNVDPNDVLQSSPRTAMLGTQVGQSAGGEWRLLVSDNSGGGTSQLASWGLSIRTSDIGSGAQTFTDSIVEFLELDQEIPYGVTVGGTVVFRGPNVTTVSGLIGGTGRLVHDREGELVLNGANTFSGGVGLGAGVVTVGHDTALGTGLLSLGGGTLRSTGTARRLGNDVSVQATSFVNAQSDLTLAGSIGGNGDLHKTGAGRLVVSGNNSSYLGATYVDAGTLYVDGSLSHSRVYVGRGGVLAGTGVVGATTIGNGAVLSPGSSPGTIHLGDTTWEGGGSYLWQINDATGVAGSSLGWDLASIEGTLAINATADNRFKFNIVSLTPPSPPDVLGAAAHFDPTTARSWAVATATGGIAGFATDRLQIDSSQFANPRAGGTFALQQNGNSIMLVYTPVPEPAVCGLVVGSALAAFGWLRRRKAGTGTGTGTSV